MNDIRLDNCRPEPLLSYLKTLGVFRLVAENEKDGDPGARLSWSGSSAVLHARFEKEDLLRFFLDRYIPTPILAPWNGGSGFYGGSSEPLDRIAHSTNARLSLYRETIRRIRRFIPASKPKNEDKYLLMLNCRNELDDGVIPWLDACYVIGEESPQFFPLLGTGANDGRLDFSNNFMQRLSDVIPFFEGDQQPDGSGDFLSAALFEDKIIQSKKCAIGQFDPGGAGGANATQDGFEADSLVNPWDFILMMEGTLLLAGSIARRMNTQTGTRAAFPFTVDPVAVGYSTSATEEENRDRTRAELWLPLWDKPFTYDEVKRLFAEGRAQLGKRQARNSIEFSLAVNLLGVDRGVTSFSRYAFLKRNGLAFIAAPLGRCVVQHRPAARLLEDPALNIWLGSMRRVASSKNAPARFVRTLHAVESAIFAYTTRADLGNDAPHFTVILTALGKAERSMAMSPIAAKNKGIRPLQRLRADWLKCADDQSTEFRLASALSSIAGSPNHPHEGKTIVGPLRVFLEPVEMGPMVNWVEKSGTAVWAGRRLHRDLAAVFLRRELEAFRAGLCGVPLRSRLATGLGDVLSFLRGETDEDKLADLVWALCALDWEGNGHRVVPGEVCESTRSRQAQGVLFEYGILKLLVEPAVVEVSDGRWSYRVPGKNDVPNIVPDPIVFSLLKRGRKDAVSEAVDRAARRLKASGFLVHGYRFAGRQGRKLSVRSSLDPTRLLASFLFPLSKRDMNTIVNTILYPPEEKE